MRTTRRTSARKSMGTRLRGGGEAGVAVMYVLLFTAMITVVTTSVMLVIASDLTAGFKQLQAVNAFNVAEGGIHYAIGKLQASGADMYGGETISMTDGLTTLGTVTITVMCLDGGILPCPGPSAPHRRIVAAGTLPTGGAARTLVAVVEGSSSGGSGYAICAYDAVAVSQGVTIYGDVGSNGSISLSGPFGSEARIRATPPPPNTNPGYYTGSALAVGAITCSQGCPTQVEGTTTPSAPPPVCPVASLPTFSPGTTDRTVTTAGWTMDSSTGYDWDEITVNAAGSSGGCTGATPWSDLRIQTGGAGTTTVVNIRKLTMGRCGRVILLGAGDVDLRVSEQTTQAIQVGQYSRFGALPTDTWGTPAPSPAGRLRVSVRSTAMDPSANAVQFDRASVISAAFNVPNGEFDADRLAGAVGNIYGTVLARRVDVDRDFVFTYDVTAAMGGAPTYSNFRNLRSWKDQ